MPNDPQQAPTLDYIMQQLQSVTDLVRNHKHTGYDLTPKLTNTSFSGGSIIGASTLGNANTSGQLTLQVADGLGDTFIKAGTIADGDFSNAGAGVGFILGIDDSDNNKAKFYFGAPGSYMQYDGSTFTVVGGVSVSKIDIPDTTTANSFHTDINGNSWWGANVAGGLGNANASITAAGNATFKSVSIGGTAIQYVITNSGIFSYGDGSDGAGTADGSTALPGATLSGGNYTLTRDVYYTDLTISTGVTVFPAGWRIFGTGVFTMNGTSIISRNGKNGSKGQTDGNDHGGAGGAPGAAVPDGYLKGSSIGGFGQGYSAGSGDVPADVAALANSVGVSGTSGGASAAGIVTASNVKLIANWHLATLLDISSSGATVKFNGSGSSSGGGAGSVAGSSVGAGGAGGSGGVIILVYNQLTNNGTIEATAGLGGAHGSALGGTHSGGGYGGGGASAGAMVAIYFRNVVIGASAKIQSNGGIGGAGGDAFQGTNSNGPNGNAGLIYEFQLSL